MLFSKILLKYLPCLVAINCLLSMASEQSTFHLQGHDEAFLTKVSRFVSTMAPLELSGIRESRQTIVIRGHIEKMVPLIHGTKIQRVFLILNVERVIRAGSHIDEAWRLKSETKIPSDERERICVQLPMGYQPSDIGEKILNVLMILSPSENIIRKKRNVLADDEENVPEDIEKRLKQWISDHGLQNLEETLKSYELYEEGLLRPQLLSWDDFFSLTESEANLIALTSEEDKLLVEHISKKMKYENIIHSTNKNSTSIPIILAMADKFLENGNLEGLKLYAKILRRMAVESLDPSIRLKHVELKHKQLEWRNNALDGLILQVPAVIASISRRIEIPDKLKRLEAVKDLVVWLESSQRNEELRFDSKECRFVLK